MISLARVPTDNRWGLHWNRVATLAHLEIRRRLRTISDNVWQVVGFGILALIMFPVSLLMLFGLFAFGSGVAEGSIGSPLELATTGIAAGWAFVAVFSGYRGYSVALRPDRLNGLLTTVSHRELVAGLVATELVFWGVPVMGLAILGAVTLAVGAGNVAVALTFLLVVAIGLLTGILLGFAGALLVRNLGVRSVLLTRLRNVFLGILFLGYLGVLVSGAFESVLGPTIAVLGPTPVGWLADVLMLPIDPAASGIRAVAAVLATGVGVLILSRAVSRLAEALWYADGITITHQTGDRVDRGRRLERVFPRPMAGVAIADWTRARRAPISLSFVIYPLFVLIGPLTETVQSGSVGSGFPLWILLCGAWITGVLFTLNVLGNEAPVLPASILSEDIGRGLVGGHLLAGIVLGGIPTVLVTVAVALASPHGWDTIVLLAAAGTVLAVASPMTATGIGVTFPRFEEVSVTRGTKAIVPSMLAFGVYSLAIAILSVPALLGIYLADSWGFDAAVVGVTITSIAGLVCGAVSTYRALRLVDGYRFDD